MRFRASARSSRSLPAGSRVGRVAAAFFELPKPRVQWLLLLTTVTSLEIAGNPPVSKVALTCLGGYLSAGGAGAVNHYWDRDIDARMRRTASRPIASGRPSPAVGLPVWFACAGPSLLFLSLSLY